MADQSPSCAPNQLTKNLTSISSSAFLSVINLTPEKLHKEAAALQMEAAQATHQLIPSSAYALEQES